MAKLSVHGALLTLALMIGAVLIVGFASVSSNSPTGFVVQDAASQVDCSQCTGNPVCAAKGQQVSTYDSACAAVCDGARVVFQGGCEDISRAVA